MKNGFYIIDSHCHIYPEKIADRAVHGTDTFYGEKSLYSGTANDLLTRGRKSGIDRFIVQSVATSPKQVGSINRFIADEVKKSNGVFLGLGTLHPDSEDIKSDIENLIALGLKGVKLHPDIQQFKIDDYRCLKIYELCEEYGLKILMHTGDYRFDFSNPNRMEPILEIYKNLTFIGAHFGGWSVWEDAVKQLSHFDNFYVDCSSTFPFESMIDKQTIQKLVDTFTPEKILFGTDYPMWSADEELENFFELKLTDDERRLILSENAKKLFNM